MRLRAKAAQRWRCDTVISGRYASFIFSDPRAGRAACILSKETQEPAGIALLQNGQSRHGSAQLLDMLWKHFVDQRAPFGGQLTEYDSLIFRRCSPSHQAPFFQFLHNVCGAGAGDEYSIPNLAKRQGTLVIQHLKHRELGHAQPPAGHMGPHASLDGLMCAPQRNDQLQRSSSISQLVRFRFFQCPQLQIFSILTNLACIVKPNPNNPNSPIRSAPIPSQRTRVPRGNNGYAAIASQNSVFAITVRRDVEQVRI